MNLTDIHIKFPLETLQDMDKIQNNNNFSKSDLKYFTETVQVALKVHYEDNYAKEKKSRH